MARVELDKLAKTFGSTRVLEPLTLTVDDGEFFTIVGPSGCGKSTLLNLIAGIEQPTAGRILFDGERVDGLEPGARDVAMVFQSYALYPHLTVRANIGFPLRARKWQADAIDAEVDHVARRLDIADLLDRKPGVLSGGQRQRVALGRALVRRPRVFLLDEPLSNLDARLRLSMREELKRLHAEYRVTTIYVTHDQEEALALSDRIAVLNGGLVQQCGTPDEIYRDPVNLFIASFIGSPPLNVIDGPVRHETGIEQTLPRGASIETAMAGLRPADMAVHPEARPGRVETIVKQTQSTGTDLWIVAEWQGQTLRARAADGFEPTSGQSAWLDLSRVPVYWFDRATGERLRPVDLMA